MKKLTVVVFVMLLICAAAPLKLGNAYLRTSRFDEITVESGDNVWLIAERYTGKKSEVPAMAEAIIEVNGLNSEAAIRAGQTLRIPLVAK